ncbi:MAG TPA: cyanophycin synthetase, partial [Pyrinomonadaceae bacterium]|nr:cyanophycin synthetase [Pyrinomonadaceae bacterium]
IRLAVLETGLGGRLDATTAAGARVLAITPVALDHQEHLGPTLLDIAAEKAGAIRAGVTERVVVARQTPEAERVILARCAECDVEPRFATRDIRFEGACDGGRARVTLRTERDLYDGVCLALRGRHQAENAAAAVAVAEVLSERGYKISREHVTRGLERAEHAGRLELIDGEPAVLLDGAHNEEGALALAAYLAELGRAPVTLVFGAMRDKDVGAILRALVPSAARLILTRPVNPRSAAPEELIYATPPRHDLSTIALAPRVADALTLARTLTPPRGLVCVTGSLYLVGEAKAAIDAAGARGA